MKNYQTAFIQFAMDAQVLKFGEFTLKSGRISPYFFNAGLFQTGSALSQLGRFYAQAIIEAKLEFDMIFGPAYKGIPLASAVAIALYEQYGNDYLYAFNRKEAKDHGEGGWIVGAPLAGRVLIIDDVMSAGTAVRESVNLVTRQGAKLAGVILALDRQERGLGELSAVQEVEQQYQVPVRSIIKLDNVLQHVATALADKDLEQAIAAYRQRYGVN